MVQRIFHVNVNVTDMERGRSPFTRNSVFAS